VLDEATMSCTAMVLRGDSEMLVRCPATRLACELIRENGATGLTPSIPAGLPHQEPGRPLQ